MVLVAFVSLDIDLCVSAAVFHLLVDILCVFVLVDFLSYLSFCLCPRLFYACLWLLCICGCLFEVVFCVIVVLW